MLFSVMTYAIRVPSGAQVGKFDVTLAGGTVGVTANVGLGVAVGKRMGLDRYHRKLLTNKSKGMMAIRNTYHFFHDL